MRKMSVSLLSVRGERTDVLLFPAAGVLALRHRVRDWPTRLIPGPVNPISSRN